MSKVKPPKYGCIQELDIGLYYKSRSRAGDLKSSRTRFGVEEHTWPTKISVAQKRAWRPQGQGQREGSTDALEPANHNTPLSNLASYTLGHRARTSPIESTHMRPSSALDRPAPRARAPHF